jgi:hypothetical protein
MEIFPKIACKLPPPQKKNIKYCCVPISMHKLHGLYIVRRTVSGTPTKRPVTEHPVTRHPFTGRPVTERSNYQTSNYNQHSFQSSNQRDGMVANVMALHAMCNLKDKNTVNTVNQQLALEKISHR